MALALVPWMAEHGEAYEAPPRLKIRKEANSGGAAFYVLEAEGDGPLDAAELAICASNAGAKRLKADVQGAIDDIEEARSNGEASALAVYVGSLIDPGDVHPAYRDQWDEIATPPDCRLPDGVMLPEGLDILDIFDPAGYPKQRQFLRSTTRYSLFLGGRGTGKSHGLGFKAFILAFLNPGCPGILLSRSYNELHSVLLPYFFEACRLFKDATGIDVIAHHNRSLQILTLINGAKVYLRSWDRVDRVRSYTVGWICLDEIEYGSARPMYAFQTIGATLRHPLAQLPQFCMATTPNGLTGVTAHFVSRQRDEQREDPDRRRYHATRATVYDNPYVDDEFREGLRLSMTERDWRQEGLGEILGPKAQVFVEYDEARHIVPWSWDRRLPYMLLVDWGTSHAYWAMVQIRPSTNGYGYQWVVAREHKLEDVGPMDVRRSIDRAVAEIGRSPAFCASDRAVKVQRAWLTGRFGSESIVQTCETKSEQDIRRGLTMLRFMLDPPEDDEPLLVFSNELPNHLHIAGRGILGAMVNLRYKRDGEGNLTNIVHKDNINDHPVDAIRYGVVTSAPFAEFHGGDVLRAMYAEGPRRVA